MKSRTLQDLPIEKLYWKIGEVAEMLCVAPSLLRFWESEFSQLHPNKNRKGDRYYSKKDIALVKHIHNLVKVEGYTINGARRQLELHPIKTKL